MPVRTTVVTSALAAAVIAVVVPPLSLVALPPAAQARTQDGATRPAQARVFFVDPVAGSDAATGRSASTPWRSLPRAVEALRPGDTLRLRAGRTHRGPLVLTADGTATSPITITRYGAGRRPRVSPGGSSEACVTIVGDRTRVHGLSVPRCGRAGIAIAGAHDEVRWSTASGSTAGIWVRPGASYALVASNLVRDNDRMAAGTPGADDDYGAFGIEVNGDHTRVTRNVIRGHHATSADYGVDGSAVEVYQAVGTTIDHNRSADNLAFTELGGSRTRDTRVAYNSVTSSLDRSTFLMTRGAGQTWGPVRGTVAEHNSVRLTGAHSFGFGCYGGCTPGILRLQRNILVAGWYVGTVDGRLATTDNLFRGELWFPLGPGDRVVDPHFVADTLRLAPDSPALDRVGPGTWHSDVTGRSLPRDGDHDGRARADLGAYER